MRNDTIKSHCGHHEDVEVAYISDKCPLCSLQKEYEHFKDWALREIISWQDSYDGLGGSPEETEKVWREEFEKS